MKGKRFAEGQIIGVLKESEAGAATKELNRRYDLRERIICSWKAKFDGMPVGEAKQELQAPGDVLR